MVEEFKTNVLQPWRDAMPLSVLAMWVIVFVIVAWIFYEGVALLITGMSMVAE